MITSQIILQRLSNAVNGSEKELYTDGELQEFAEFYLDKWDDNTSEDVIAEAEIKFGEGAIHWLTVDIEKVKKPNGKLKKWFIHTDGLRYNRP